MTPRRPLVLVGPTASGKSSVALELARRRLGVPGAPPVELVSCDSMQVYRGMDVGTATPTAAERAEVAHHLLDVVDPDEEFHVAEFQRLVAETLDDIASRGAEAVLVGGTGLYVRAVVDDLRVPGRYPEVAERLAGWSDDELTRRLAELDPVAARRVPAGNRRRLLRALEVTIGSGTPFSASGPGLDHYGPTRFLLAGLAVPREQLGGRVEGRFRRQLEDGLVAEAAALLRRPGGLSRTAAAALGYQELFDHLAGRCTLDEAIASAVRRTRRFAVRQERWFRRDPRIRWFAAPDDPGDAGPGASSERTGTTASRRPADVAEELDRWWSESAVVADGGAATVTSAGAPATDPAGDGPEPTSCD